MATNHSRFPQRRTGAQRVKVDENALSRHPRVSAHSGPVRVMAKENLKATTATRKVLTEVTTTAVNRREPGVKPVTGKDLKEGIGMKRGRSDSTTFAQRVPLGPGRGQVAPPVANIVNAVRVPISRVSIAKGPQRTSRIIAEQIREEAGEVDSQSEIDVENGRDSRIYDHDDLLRNEREVEKLVGIEDSDTEDERDETPNPTSSVNPRRRQWPEMDTDHADKWRREVEAIRQNFEDGADILDTSMVSEYSEEIFEYMSELETEVMPNANYMDGQHEISWSMRQTLVDWLLQVHLRYHMLPETLWIAINIVDRFLTKRVVSLLKLQLVGVTAMFIAAKYEEILAPSVEEFVIMTDNGYSKDEILKGERIMLQTLEFRISHYCSPYSWMRKISRADQYDIQTRTLSKFLTEVTLLDYRFLAAKPSLIAAVGMYCARRMLGGDWNAAFVFHSEYTEEYLLPGHILLIEKLTEAGFHKQYVCKKYAHKKYLQAAVYAIEWARANIEFLDDAPLKSMKLT